MSAGAIVIRPDDVRVPVSLDFEAFRAWARSDAFPERGRIDYLGGEVDIDMSPEEGMTHATPKVEIVGQLQRIVKAQLKIGAVFSDRMRVSAPGAGLSAEPDVLVLLHETVRSGRVKLVPRSDRKEGRFIEIEGPVDLVVECVSDSSVKKDTQVLRELYHKAGVGEYWIADARKSPPRLEVLRWATAGYEEMHRDAQGFVDSPLLARGLRLVRSPGDEPIATYDLEERPAPA